MLIAIAKLFLIIHTKNSAHMDREIKKVTTNTLQKMKDSGEKISMITAYDF